MRLTNQQFCVQHKKLSFNWEQLSLSNKQQVGLAMVLQVTQLFLKSLLVYKANKSIQNSRSSFHLCQLQLKTCKISIFIGSTLIRALLIGNIISKVAISYNTHSKPSNWSAGQWFVLLQARFEKRVLGCGHFKNDDWPLFCGLSHPISSQWKQGLYFTTI